MKSAIKGILLALALSLLAPVSSASADDPNPSTSEIDNYANLVISSAVKQGFAIGASTFMNSSRSNFSVEAWINPSDSLTSTYGDIFIKQDSFIFRLNNLKPEVGLQTGGWAYFTSAVALRTNEWQHIAFTKSSSTLKILVNGFLIYQTNSAGASVLSQSSYVGIGANPWNGANQTTPQSEFFAGGIDEVRVWSGARTDAEIANNMDTKLAGSTSNLLGYWDFNGNGSSSTLYDRTTNGNNMTIYGSPSFPDVKTVVTSSGYSTVTFTRTYLNANGAFKIPTGVTSINLLVVGGGGGGGYDGGGGGGGGGVYQNSTAPVTSEASYAVEVGGGGPAINGYVGNTYCTGTWTNAATGCVSGSGNSSSFGSLIASGGGGGGGIEASGNSDSNSSATVRGGGGGGGSQNTKTGATSGGAGAFAGGGSSDVNTNAGGGGASSAAAGSSTTSTLAGNGAAGVTATLNGLVYGSGGGGGSYNNATVATGGTGAGDGGTSGASASKPLANRGGGGGGGGVGNLNASSGAAGVVIIKYALRGFATLSFTNAPVYRSATSITAATNTASKVTFLANNKRIAGCIKVATVNLVATCNWRPSVHNSITISIQIYPNDSNYSSSSASASAVISSKRTGNR